MARRRIPDDVLAAAHDRARAREARDWPEADRLRAAIEAAGWKIVDRGTDFALSPAAPPDLADEGRVRYGSSRNVPSRLDEPEMGVATVVLVATDWPDDLARAVKALRATSPAGTSFVVVADAPSAEQETALDALRVAAADDEPAQDVVWTSGRLGHGAALNAGLRRATGPVAIVLDSSVQATGDIVTPIVHALDDPTVAVTGRWGIVSQDLRHFEDAPFGDVDAVEGYCLAFRRADFVERGPLDERFTFYRNLDIWWSLILRDEGPDRLPRRAVSIDIPAVRHEHRGFASLPEAERGRLSKRNFYRILDRFGDRRDLLVRG